mmetsp:Transcript_21957/g.50144  ORF Transcript_21957/g.50144 Transcript_21957/m.50144 type:complete len:483 (-) Transcript_21957:130-1578(-)
MTTSDRSTIWPRMSGFLQPLPWSDRRASRVWQAFLLLALGHGATDLSVHLLRVVSVLVGLLTAVPIWAPPLQLWHLLWTFVRVVGKRVTGCGHRTRWSFLAELFIEGTRPMPIFTRHFHSCILPTMQSLTLLDRYGENLASALHPRAHFEYVTQGCPRPMTWVWYSRERAAKPVKQMVLLFLHGGGYWCFTGRSHLEYVARLVKALNGQGNVDVRACVIDLRRAPEHPWPAPLEDAVSCYEWLQRGAGFQPSQIIVAGDSAGGGLALCLLLALRDSLKTLPLCALLISPLTDLARAKEQYPEQLQTDFLPLEAIEVSMKFYTPEGEDPRNPLISPKYGALHSLSLCPILIQAGENELLARDSIDFARRLEAYGGVVQLELYPEMPHIFPMLALLGLADAHAAIARQAEFTAEVSQGQESLRGKKVKVLVHDKRARSFETLPATGGSRERRSSMRRKLSLVVSSPDMNSKSSTSERGGAATRA